MKYCKDEAARSLGIGNVCIASPLKASILINQAPIFFVVHSMGGLVFKKVGYLKLLEPVNRRPWDMSRIFSRFYVCRNRDSCANYVDQAYLLGLIDDDYKDIVTQIRSVLFLSTPHRGTDLAEMLNRILSVSLSIYSPKTYISELNRNSPALEDINETFRNIAPNLDVYSFYETLETAVGPRRVVGVFEHVGL